ncbi:unnamed protein product [Arctia plantaginis]|uniref:Uncharacterized protein n=1 Tax=Arctia plantaginis TaxID=874455 RepID=A0A8S1AYW0_ARCPL|nr:unnamed protein product [Arctia plantaginis]
MISAVVFGSLFKDLTGIVVTESDGLPQWLCYECSALLTKSVRFQRKMLKAHNILYQYLTRCAPFPIDANDEELSKYTSPYLAQTVTLSCDVSKGKNASYQVFEHEKQPNNTSLDDSPLLDLPKPESDVKEEMGFSDYDDNITLDEFRSAANEIMEDDIESLLRPNTPTEVAETETKKKKKTKKKTKEKKNKISDDEKPEGETGTKSSIRKTITLDPQKIRIITLNPEEQIKQKEEEARTNLKFPFQCNLCHKGFNFEAKLANHMNKHSPSRGPFECKLCQMYLPTSYSFNVHSLIHTRRYECVDCGRRMIDRSSIIDHYRTQHEGMLTLFTCNLCGKVSNNNKTHRGHMRNHHGADRPKCDQCGKTFVNKDSLTEHLQIHQGIKNYECSICGKKFRTRTQIKHHQLKHTDVKEFYCVECDVRFKSAHNLRQHLQKSLRHKDKGSLIYGCSSCSKRFESSAALAAHVRVQHEGVRAHACATCGAALASAASLAKHARTVHAARRAPPKHVCHTCGRLFRGKSVLTNHVRTHTGEKPFECSSCGRKFSQRTAMRTHVKLVHLKMRRQPKVKPEMSTEQLQPAPKLEVFKPDTPLEPWRQPCDVYFQVTVPKAYS